MWPVPPLCQEVLQQARREGHEGWCWGLAGCPAQPRPRGSVSLRRSDGAKTAHPETPCPREMVLQRQMHNCILQMIRLLKTLKRLRSKVSGKCTK